MSNLDTKKQSTLTVVHEFNAPKELVFEAFGNAEALNEWWGPAESQNSVITLDFRPGGIFHYRMNYNGKITYGRFVFGRIEPFDLLEFTNAFSDEHANITKAPFDIPIPMEISYQLNFSELNGRTTLTLTGEPVNASNEEIESFRSINLNVQQGFGATFDKLAVYLKTKRKNT